MSTLGDSRAREAFAGARDVLDEFALPSPHVRPAFAFSGAPPDDGDTGAPAVDVAGGAAGAHAVPSGTRFAGLRGPLAAAAGHIAAGEVTSRDLVEEALAAVAARNDELVAIVDLDESRALAAAEERDAERARGIWRGPLHGIPITVKDVIDVAGFTTRAGSDAYRDRPAADAAAVARLRRGGAVVIGKASTHEFALGVTSPQSRNPHDPTRLPGGSSGGSAIAVATGMGLGSLGTDTRASIRVPAALSGVVGFKPTIGTVPTDGVVSLSWTMDHVAPMAATVADAGLLLEVLVGAAPGSLVTPAAAGGDLGGLRVGVPAAAFDDADGRVEAVVGDAVAALGKLGAEVVDSARPAAGDFALANAAGLVVSRCEAASFHRGLDLDRSRYWAEVDEQLAEAATISAVDYLDAQRARAVMVREMRAVFDTVDLLAMPTSPVLAPPAQDYAAYLMLLARNAIPWSFVGFPAVSVPAGWVEVDPGSPGGPHLPVGLQLVAPPGREDLLLRAGIALEAALA